MHERLSLLKALRIQAVRDLGKEHGEVNFDRFVELAKQSSVPTAFAGAIEAVVQTVKRGSPDMDSDEVYLQTATRLFEREFTNPRIADYAIIYGHALALTKTWLEENDKLERLSDGESRLQEYLQKTHPEVKKALDHDPGIAIETLRGVLEYQEYLVSEVEATLDMIQEEKPILRHLVEYIRSEAVINCGYVVALEQSQKNKSIRQTIGERLLGEYATERDFGRIRIEIEEYFADPMKQTRMTHLAYSGKR